MKIDFEKLPQTVAIVGSRTKSKDEAKWTDRERKLMADVADFVSKLKPSTIVVSGGALGADTAAETAARALLTEKPVIYLPDKSLPIPQRFHDRNKEIVVHCKKKGGLVFAFAFVDEKMKITSGTRNCTEVQCNTFDVPYVLYRLDVEGRWLDDVLVGRAFAFHEKWREIFLR